MTQQVKVGLGTGAPFLDIFPKPVIARRTPTTADVGYNEGRIWYDEVSQAFYACGGTVAGQGIWILLGSSSGAIDTVNGTAGQITSTPAGNITTLSLPSAVTTPGSLTTTTSLSATTSVTAGTTVTATLGAITATNGNLVLGTAGNKVIIPTGANASVGTSAAMTAGAVTVATTASSATAKIFWSRATVGGTPGNVSITAQNGTGFTLTSSSNTETSTFNWWIINA